MKLCLTRWILAFVPALAVSVAMTNAALAQDAAAGPVEEEKGSLLRPKVDQPIPDTYEPLGGTRWDEGDAHTQEIRESWELKKQAEGRQEVVDEEPAPAISPATRRIPIQESIPGAAPAVQDGTVVEEGDESLRIREN
jgi:hypothetical protein